MKENIVAAQRQRPDKIDPALPWFCMTDGEVDKAVDPMQKSVKEKAPVTVFMRE